MRGDYGSSFALPADDVLLMRHADAEEIAVIAVAARRGLVLPFWFVACGLVGCACVSFLLGRTVGDARPPAATRTASVPPPDCYDPVFFKDPANKSVCTCPDHMETWRCPTDAVVQGVVAATGLQPR